MDFGGQSRPFILPPWVDLLWGAVFTALWMVGAARLYSSSGSMFLIAALLYGFICVAVLTRWPRGKDFGWANRATLFRSSLIVALVAGAPFIPAHPTSTYTLWIYAVGALIALILDGVDGKLARVTHSASAFGARFDMEMDALLILGLCVAVTASGKAGTWVIALGLMRYLFVAAAFAMDWLNHPLPESFRRKTICVWQIVTLMVAIVPPIPPMFASLTLATALLLLAWSFMTDVYWLYERRFHYETL
ncbi:Phosphatidylglycerophosphate synthase [Marinobacter sp. LV10R510-11A]|uniref:CDP-alcohol phosphatidyltransferase family protein n=1 Tax=Marinobacter sp. LV10R510-11A TaxID=1415568 RepID=UPI000BB9566C|nr:CDP-alcohol phosphatidyltransferase family protein [Marinobacter sp. LV10R510-11A]SOB75120.1 Phosphatidylglycerophosphate synthase [Marinobacter sp. LV10R510-11A]